MKVTYTFESPDDDEERRAFEYGYKWMRRVDGFILEIRNLVRRHEKYDEDAENIMAEISEVLSECPDLEDNECL